MASTTKKVVITGAAGFIGSHLVRKYLTNGWSVVGVDCLDTGSQENVDLFAGEKNYKFLRHDITKPFHEDAELYLNFACPASPVHYQRDPVWTARTCFEGTLNVLELARKNKARMIQASTSEVYGDPLEHPQKESYRGNVNTIGIRSCYDEGKRVAETLCFDFKRQHGVDIGLIRIFNTYGPQMALDDGRVVSNFLVQALTNQDITIYGTGGQTRSFCYADDLVEGIFLFSQKKDTTGPINLGNDGEFTVKELADKVLNLIPESKSKIVYKPLPEDDPKTRKPELSFTKKTISWQPRVLLEDGLKKSLPYFREAVLRSSATTGK